MDREKKITKGLALIPTEVRKGSLPDRVRHVDQRHRGRNRCDGLKGVRRKEKKLSSVPKS